MKNSIQDLKSFDIPEIPNTNDLVDRNYTGWAYFYYEDKIVLIRREKRDTYFAIPEEMLLPFYKVEGLTMRPKLLDDPDGFVFWALETI